MHTYHIEKSAVSPAEAVRITYKTSWSVVIKTIPKLANDIWDELESLAKETRWNGENIGRMYLATIWMAGRLQGIREERAWRKGLKEV